MNIKKYILILALGCLCSIKGQTALTVEWGTYPTKKIKVGNYVDLFFTVNINPDWYIHSVNQKNKNGKNTVILFYENEEFKVIGKPEAIYEIEEINQSNKRVQYIFFGEGIIAIKIKVLKENPVIKGQIQYKLCRYDTEKVIPKIENFKIPLQTKK